MKLNQMFMRIECGFFSAYLSYFYSWIFDICLLMKKVLRMNFHSKADWEEEKKLSFKEGYVFFVLAFI